MIKLNSHAILRLFFISWLCLLIGFDLALFVWAAPLMGHGGGEASQKFALSFELISRIFYWLGLLIFLNIIYSVFYHYAFGNLVRSMLYIVARLFLVAGFAYLIFVWSHIIANRHLPNPDALFFLIYNLALLPQHIFQTSPILSILMAAVLFAIVYTTEKAIIYYLRPLVEQGWLGLARPFILGVVMLSIAYSAAVAATSFRPKSIYDILYGDKVTIHGINEYLDSLRDRTPPSLNSVPQKKYPVVVILIESLRSDLLSLNPDSIPFLKSLHDSQVGFHRSYATASHSNLSDLAFWYSQYPLRGKGMESFPVDAPWRGSSIFKAFKDAGYPTAYISSQNEKWGSMINWLKNDDVSYFFHSEDYDRETWENFDDLPGLGGMIRRGLVTAGKVEDSETLRIAKEWIDQRSLDDEFEGFFLGMNLQNTHFSYVMPPGGIEPNQPSDLGFKAIYYSWPRDKKENVRNRYLNAVTNVDRLLADFADYLQGKGLWDECIFVVVGDNGEAFYEHGFGNHSGPMYDEAVRTFSVIKLPDSFNSHARLIEYPVSHIDIAATIPSIAGLITPESFQGISLYPLPIEQRPVYMYSNAIVKQYGIVYWPWKLLLTELPNLNIELFNMQDDPLELTNVARSNYYLSDKLAEKLLFWIESQKKYYGDKYFLSKAHPLYIGID